MASSIRMIQQPPATANSPAGAGESPPEASSSSGERAPASAQASKSITVTKTLEVAPATARLTTVDEIHSSGARSFVQSPAVDNQARRPATGVSPTIRLPAIPNISSIDLTGPGHPTIERPIARPKTAPGPSNASYERAVQPKLPPFMQSRHWARKCEAPRPKTSGHSRAVSEEDRPMTLREASFEQQRAAWRHVLPVARQVQATEEAESVVEASGLCRTVSLPTWQLIRVTRGIRGCSEPSNSLLHRLTPQRGSKSSRHSRRQSVEKSAPRISRASQIGRKRAMSDLRKRASTGRRDTSSHVVDLDMISPAGAIGRLPSPIPSLHDPEKAKRFSEECEALLTNKDFEKDFLSTSAGPARSAASHPDQPKNSDGDRNSSIPASGVQVIDAPRQASGIVVHGQEMPIAAQPPVRTSSKGGARLETVVRMTKPACIPILNGFKDRAFVAPEDAASGQSTPQNTSPRPRPSRIPFRMASVTSIVSEASRSPRPVKSTDTLTLIEAQVRTPPQSSQPRRTKKAAVPKAVSSKQLGPSGTPPERPLPELPPDRGSMLSKTPPRSSITSSHRQSNPIEASPAKDVLRTNAMDEAPPGTSQPGLAPGLTIKESKKEPESVQPSIDQIPGTPTSVHSQSSLMSDATGKNRFARHDKSQFRADRMKQLRRRIKADLEREKRISEEREDSELDAQKGSPHPDSKPTPTTEHEIKPQPSLDQLDQFPAVPPSRPASRTSHHRGPPRRTDSRSHGHVRQSSKGSSRLSQRPVAPRPASRAVLGTSQIRVLVDTDPVTGHFRAGAMTPDQGSLHDGQGLDGSSPQRAAFKGVRATALPNRIDENGQMNVPAPRAKTSMRSIRSHASAISARHSVAWSRQSSRRRRPSAETPTGSLVDSSDDENLLLSVGKNGKRRLRRRWNSNDIRTVQGLYEDLDHYYETLIRQEQELQKQREEIQRMVRVLAPVSRANGLCTATFSTERQEFVDAGISLDDVSSTRAPSAASTMKPIPRTYTPSLTGAPSPAWTTASSAKDKRASKASSRARLDAASTALDSVIRERPISDLSIASATTDVSRGSRSSKDNSAAEGSMTDPFEYDVGPVKAAAAATKGAKHGLAIHGHTLSGTLSLAQSSGGERGSSRPQSTGACEVLSSKQRSPAPLHNPPPVAKVNPRGTLSEEEEEDDRESVLLRSAVPGLGVELGKGMLRSTSGLSCQSRVSHSHNRLSVNHVFTRTEEMDRMLSVISALD